MDAEARIARVWRDNAEAWQRAVREGRIASRREVTDQAILQAVLALRPRRVIDSGCGEGWLARALAQRGVAVCGIDAEPGLIAAARQADPQGDYRVLDYARLAAAELPRADVVVCNFSLLGEASVDALLAAVPRLLHGDGRLLVQTLHPRSLGEQASDGWREGSWAGCGEGFGEAAPWYFRSLAGWRRSLQRAGLRLESIGESCHADGRPASLLLQAAVPGAPRRDGA